MKFLHTLALCLCSIAVCAGSDFADSLYKAGLKAERAGDTLHAYLLFARAAALDPANVAYAAKKTSLRLATTRAMREDLGPDPTASDRAPDSLSVPDASDMKFLPPPELAPSQEKKSFNLKGDGRAIFEQVAAAYGLQVVFEADYQTPPPFSFRLDDASAEDALRGLETVSNSFLVPVNSKLALVVRDNPTKRTERMQNMAVAIPIPERMTPQDAQEMLTAVQQSLDLRRAVLDAGKHQVFLRGEVSKVQAAQRLLADLSKIRPQVEIEVEFLAMDKTSSLNYGISLPMPISLVNFQGTQMLSAAFSALRSFAGAATPYAIGITQASAFATLARASATNLLNAQMSILDGQAATLHVGQHFPIASNQYVGGAGQTGTVYTPPPTITYEDLGLVLKVTPSVHLENSVTLDVDAEFKTLGASSTVAGVPIIASNKYTGKVRLEEGEWAVIAGLVQSLDTNTRSGIPGLMDIPWIGKLFTNTTIEKDRSEILVILKPHVTAAPPWEELTHPIWVGTDTRPVTLVGSH